MAARKSRAKTYRRRSAPRTRRSPAPARRSRGERSGYLVWLIPLGLGLIILYANAGVRQHLETFLTTLQKKQAPQRAAGHDARPIQRLIRKDQQQLLLERIEQERPTVEPQKQPAVEKKQRKPDTARETPKKTKKKPAAKRPRPEKQQATSRQDTRQAGKGRSATLYFVRYDASGDRIRLVATKRTLPRSDSPAQDVLQALMRGPSKSELKRGLRTLIPHRTRILGMAVKDNILEINLSREFVYNQKFGKEGLTLQIYQIVNSMAVFPTVKGVRFLINGQQRRTAGGDGLRLDKVFHFRRNPLS